MTLSAGIPEMHVLNISKIYKEQNIMNSCEGFKENGERMWLFESSLADLFLMFLIFCATIYRPPLETRLFLTCR